MFWARRNTKALPTRPHRLPPAAQVAAVSASDLAHIDTKEAVRSAETLDKSLPDSSQILGPETPPVQVATVSTPDLVHSEAKEAVSSAATLDAAGR